MKLKQILLGLASIGIVSFALAPTPVSALECGVLPPSMCSSADEDDLGKSGLWQLLLLAIRILSAVVGLVAVAAIVFAGILYATAQDREDQLKKAKDMILQTVIGLLLFIFMWAILEWLVPGGLFR